MTTKEIIKEALTYRWYDKRTNQEYEMTTGFEIDRLNNIIIRTPIKPFQLVLLRRLLKLGKKEYNNIVIGNPYI